MERKKWTPKGDVTQSDLQFREKRKWQIALRRYVLERNPSSFYAPYFGLDIESFRKWIEIQFDKELSWESFSKSWQFDHIIPVAYFDFQNEEDLKLCWNFVNIRVERIHLNKNRGARVDVLATKAYFESIYRQTGYVICNKLLEKISSIELSVIENNTTSTSFILENRETIEMLSSFGSYEFKKINEGVSLNEVLAERTLLKKFSGL